MPLPGNGAKNLLRSFEYTFKYCKCTGRNEVCVRQERVDPTEKEVGNYSKAKC